MTVPTIDDGRAAMATVLTDLGVDVANAPDGALGHAEQVVCGGEQLGHDGPTGPGRNDTARRCFLDAHLAAVRAAFVSSASTPEGDPVVDVWLSGPAGVDVWYDSTRDAFGSGEWSPVHECERLTTISPYSEPLEPPTAFWCVDGRDHEAERAPQDPAGVPAWFTQRSVLPLCGVAVSLDVDDAERQCFIDARDAGAPAEFAYVAAVGDAGERFARWFRSLGDGRFEAMESQASADGNERIWYRYECSSITYFEDPVSDAWQLPAIESTCTEVDSLPVDAPPPATVPTIVDPIPEGCLDVPDIELTSRTGRVAMELIYYSEMTDTCGLNADGVAMADDGFRPATALVVADGALAIAPERPGDVSFDVRPLEPGMRLADLGPSDDVLTVASDGTYPISLPGPGCFVVTVAWGDDVSSGGYAGLAESEPGTCSVG